MCIFIPLEECLQGKFLEVGLLGEGINPCIVWLDVANYPSQCLYHLASLPAVNKSAYFPIALPTEYSVELSNVYGCSW